jgi:hypothetical protein
MPISLLITFSNVLEKVVYRRLSHYTHSNNRLVPEKFDIRKEMSIENQYSKYLKPLTKL